MAAPSRPWTFWGRFCPKRYPGIQIAGMYSPPFRPLSAQEDRAAVAAINDAKPDFVWVGLGAPKQEIWMNGHQGQVNGLMVGVGAAFDYAGGEHRPGSSVDAEPQSGVALPSYARPRTVSSLGRYLRTNTVYLLQAQELRGK